MVMKRAMKIHFAGCMGHEEVFMGFLQEIHGKFSFRCCQLLRNSQAVIHSFPTPVTINSARSVFPSRFCEAAKPRKLKDHAFFSLKHQHCELVS